MKLNERPNMLILNDLLQPAIQCSAALSEIEEEASKGALSEVVRHGLLVLAVAHFETMVLDTLRCYLLAIPEKIPKQGMTVAKEDLLAHPFDLIEVQVDKFLRSAAYDGLSDILRQFCDLLSLDDANHQSLAKPVREIKASRNILLHNKLVTNGAYLEQAGESRRAKEEGKKLNIDRTYLDNSVRAFASVVSEMKCLMQAKYASYTKLAAIRRLWDFCFKSPVMPFEDFWTVNEDRDCIVSSKRGRCEDGLSGSETVFLGVWRTHFNAYRPDLKPIYIRGLDEHHQAKLFFLLSVFRHLWLE